MCNFVIRPIKSYATIEVKTQNNKVIKRGDVITVQSLSRAVDGTDLVSFYIGEASIGSLEHLPLNVFVHAFVNDQKDV